MSSRPIGSIKLAEFISSITNPCILSVAMLFAILAAESNRLATLALQSLALLLLLVILPLVYSYVRMHLSPNGSGSRFAPTVFLKQHPRDILVLGLVCGLPCWLILKYLHAPVAALHTIASLLAVALVIAMVNLFYRASFHLAAMTVLVYMATAIWGQLFLILVPLIALVAWAKYRLGDHSVAQLGLGVALAVVAASIAVYVPG